MTSPEITSTEFEPAVEYLTDLTPEDVEDFTRLLPQLSNTPRTLEQIENNLRTALDSPTTRIFVIRDELGRIQSTATGNKCPIPTGFKAWVDDVVTDEAYRGKHYGEMVTGAIEEWLQEDGITSVNLTSTPARGAAGNLYERMGYEQRDTRVYRHQLGHTAVSKAARS